ncbi:Inner centromere protein, ARK-binding domain [Dillenia turbinata]|uniref:Inner centromere protein, ARK-binding domain n=1 Tax=Dillenia turbinata TaxID=194707 RepID=A0AAN8VJ59_9MAGN
MAMIEKLFVQIFEKKQSIINEVKHQTDLYDQHLLSKLLIRGIKPPPWLCNSSFSPDLQGLNKEELLSKLLFPCSIPAIPYSNNLFEKPAVAVNNGQLSQGLHVGANVSDRALDERNEPTIAPQYHVNENAYASLVAASPKDEINVKFSIYSEPDQSCARIQRSKSRQRAIELRNSAKARATSLISSGIKTSFDCSGVIASGDASEKSGNVAQLFGTVNSAENEVGEGGKGDCSSKEDSSDVPHGRLTRSQSCCLQASSANKSLKPNGSVDVANRDSRGVHVTSAELAHQSEASDAVGCTEFQGEQVAAVMASQKDLESFGENSRDPASRGNDANAYPGRSSRLHSACHYQDLSICTDSGYLASRGNVTNRYGGRITRSQSMCINKNLSIPAGSGISGCKITTTRVAASNMPQPAKSSDIGEGSMPPKALSTQECILLVTNGDDKSTKDKSVKAAEETKDVSNAPSNTCLSDILCNNLDLGLEASFSRPSSDCSKLVKPKQLDFEVEDESISKIAIPDSVEGKSLEKRCSLMQNHGASPNKQSYAKLSLSTEMSAVEEHKTSRIEEKAQRASGEAEPNKGVEVQLETNEINKLCQVSSPRKSSSMCAVSSIKGILEVSEDADGCSLGSLNITKSTCSPDDTFAPGQTVKESLLKTIFDNEVSSHSWDVDSDRGTHLCSGKSIYKVFATEPGSRCLEGTNSGNECNGSLKYSLAPTQNASESLVGTVFEKDVCSKWCDLDSGRGTCCSEKNIDEIFVAEPARTCLEEMGNECIGSLKYSFAASETARKGLVGTASENKVSSAFYDVDSSGGTHLSSEKNVGKIVVAEAASTYLEDNELGSECNGSLNNSFAPLHMARGSLVGTDFNNEVSSTSSDVDTDRGIHLCSKKSSEEFVVAEPASTCLEDTELGNECDGSKMSTDCESDKAVRSTLASFAVDIPHADSTNPRNENILYRTDPWSAELQTLRKGTSHLLGNFNGNSEIIFSDERRENCNVENSLQQERGLSLAKEAPWPQFKRQKVKPHLFNVASPSPNLRLKPFQNIRHDISKSLNTADLLELSAMPVSDPASGEMDIVQTDLIQSPDVKIHRSGRGTTSLARNLESSNSQHKQGGTSTEGMIKTERPSLDLVLEQIRKSALSACLLKESEVVDPTSIIVDETNQSTSENNHQIEMEDHLGIKKVLACAQKGFQESKSPLQEDGIVACSSFSLPHTECSELITMLERFNFNAQLDCGPSGITREVFGIDETDLPYTAIERACFLEQLCKSVSIDTPLNHFPMKNKFLKTTDLFRSVPNGLLEHMDLREILPVGPDGEHPGTSYGCVDEKLKLMVPCRSYSDGAISGTRVGWEIRKPYVSPIGKLWDRSKSISSSSEKERISNPELNCFPIEEDLVTIEENDNMDELADASNGSAKKELLADITAECQGPPSISVAKAINDRYSLDSVNNETNFTGACNTVKQKLGNHKSGKSRFNKEMKENLSFSLGTNGVRKGNESLRSALRKPKLSSKSSLRKGGQSFSDKDPKRNNIVANVKSFIPFVQRNQPVPILTGKRDVKVKALEAAEAAKRLAEKKENERKMKKEAMKLERARLEQENLKQLELMNKKKEEERRKKDADLAVRKRQREEEEKMEKERKRKRNEEARKRQREQERKVSADEEDKELNYGERDHMLHKGKESQDETRRTHKKEKKESEDDCRKPETALPPSGVMDGGLVNFVNKICQASSHCAEIGRAMSIVDEGKGGETPVVNTSREQSYEISPYQSSDDEDEDEEEADEKSNRKFVPSWASKSQLSVAVDSLQGLDPDKIFPLESFPTTAEGNKSVYTSDQINAIKLLLVY